MERDDLLTFRIPRDLKVALKKAAAQDERSMSMMAVRILREWLATHGYYEDRAAESRRSGRRSSR